jgi:hypothetical protein
MRPRFPKAPMIVATTACGLLLALTTGCPPPQTTTTAPPRARPAPDRLKGDWHLQSTLGVRQGVGEPAKLLLALNHQLQDILEGKIRIDGVPGALTALMGPFVSQTLKKLVPTWAAELVRRLKRIDDALNDIRIESIETLRAVGDNRYEGHSRWLRVTVKSGNLQVTGTPKEVPGLGALKATTYTAAEHTSHLRISNLKVNHQLGKLYRWAAEALLGGVTCSTKHIPCFRTVEQVIGALVPCAKLATMVAQAAPALSAMAPLIQAGCESQKKRVVKMIGLRLDKFSLRLTFVKLRGDARIDGDRLVGGRWQGTLGKVYGGGDFSGTFTGRRAGQ